MRNYLSFGGGVNSVALYLYLIEQNVKFEAVFSHHGTDWPETYDYVAGFQWWLKHNGFRPITVLRPNIEGYSELISYYEHHKIIPSFMNRGCTDKFKIRTLHKYYKKPSFEMIGIDWSEKKRAKINSRDGYECRYPLIEAKIDREGCKRIIRRWGLPIPMKSGCYICPFQKRSQFVTLRFKHPCLFERAVQLEIRNNEKRKERGKAPIYISAGRKVSLSKYVGEQQSAIFEQDEYPPCECML